MGVLADDRGDRARAGEALGERRLERIRCVPELGAPVQVDDHDLRAGAARAPGVAQDQPGAGEVDRPAMRRRDPVRHLRVRQQRDAHAVGAEQERAPPLPARGERSGVADAGALQRPPRGVDPGLPAVERVVRGGAAGVKAGRLDRACERRRGVEPRVADRRRRRQRRLDVAERERVAPHPAADRPQQRPEVIAAPVRERPRAGDDRQVRQQVAADADGQPDRPLRRRGRDRRRRDRERRRLAVWRVGRAAGAERDGGRGDHDGEQAHRAPTLRPEVRKRWYVVRAPTKTATALGGREPGRVSSSWVSGPQTRRSVIPPHPRTVTHFPTSTVDFPGRSPARPRGRGRARGRSPSARRAPTARR